MEDLGFITVACNGKGAPDWIEIIPAGETIQGRDGRSWANPDPESVVATFQARNRPVPLDWEHATVVRGGQGQDAPAAGWASPTCPTST